MMKPHKYFIKKGKHYSQHGIKFHFGISRKKFGFLFFPSCFYDTFSLQSWPGTDNLSINKLFGWSYGRHHTNSVRVGWRPDSKGKIDLFFYCYNNGKRITHYFTTVNHSVDYEINIIIYKDSVCFEINEEKYPYEIISTKIPFIRPWFRWGYYLYFYFGGSLPAPHDMAVLIF